MPILVLIIVLLIGPSTLTSTGARCLETRANASAGQNVNAEEAVLKVTREWLDAEERHDRATLQRIIADDFEGTAARGNTVLKKDIVPQAGAEAGSLSISTSDMKVRFFGDTAVLTAHGVQKSGEKRELRLTIIFTKRDNQWQMVGGHISAVPTS
ncbi:MAG TPA: nuclear transport factor 2 family protein [Pyrinomonadaceae bacterium]|nr:nuclear transport factor 2 family protein [Pyrinomonadaceae bacterium]